VFIIREIDFARYVTTFSFDTLDDYDPINDRRNTRFMKFIAPALGSSLYIYMVWRPIKDIDISEEGGAIGLLRTRSPAS